MSKIIHVDQIPGTDNSIDFGTLLKRIKDMYVSGDLHAKTVGIMTRFGAEGSHATAIAYSSIGSSDIALDMSDFKRGTKLYMRFKIHLKISGGSGSRTVYARIYRQNAASAVTGSEVTATGSPTSWHFAESSWIDMSAESGDESYQIQLKNENIASADVEYNSATMELSPVAY